MPIDAGPSEAGAAGAAWSSGTALARAYWDDVVRPLLDTAAPRVPRAAARIGTGSEVLGLDDAMSRDHDWGLRLQLFVPRDDAGRIRSALDDRLPPEYAGLPTRITYSGANGPVLGVDVLTVEGALRDRLGFDPRVCATAPDWLSLTGQAVLEWTAGEVFEDTGGELTSVREALAWYPDDVWRYVVACDWHRLDQELPIMQRAGHRGDELGSRVVAARLAGIAMNLGFLVCRRWAPYPKWRGTMFARLPLPAGAGRSLQATLDAADWHTRGERLAAALGALADAQAGAGLPTVAPVCEPFWDRPYLHVAPAVVPQLLDSIVDPAIRRLPVGVGSVEQSCDNVDVLMYASRRRMSAGQATTPSPAPFAAGVPPSPADIPAGPA